MCEAVRLSTACDCVRTEKGFGRVALTNNYPKGVWVSDGVGSIDVGCATLLPQAYLATLWSATNIATDADAGLKF